MSHWLCQWIIKLIQELNSSSMPSVHMSIIPLVMLLWNRSFTTGPVCFRNKGFCDAMFTTHLVVYIGEAHAGFRGRGDVVRCEQQPHRRDNRGEKPYQCQHCPKKFSLKHQLDTHHRVHTGRYRIWRCCWCCVGWHLIGLCPIAIGKWSHLLQGKTVRVSREHFLWSETL